MLNLPQREHLTVLLAQMERALDKLGSGVRSHRLTVVDDDLPHDFERRIEPIIDRIRNQIDALVERFDLTPRRESLARSVSAIVTAELVRIEDSYSRNLHGYGEVAAGLPEVLDPALRDLHESWHAISRVLGEQR